MGASSDRETQAGHPGCGAGPQCPSTHLRSGASCGWTWCGQRAAPGWRTGGPGQRVLRSPASHPGERWGTATGSAHASPPREGTGMGSWADCACLGRDVQICSGGTTGLLQNRAWKSQGVSISWMPLPGDSPCPAG